MSGRLVRNDVRNDPPVDNLRMGLGAVAHESYGERPSLSDRGTNELECFVQVVGHAVTVAGVEPLLYAGPVDLDVEADAAVHRDRQRLRAPHAAHSAGQNDPPLEATSEVLSRALGQGLVRALEYALRADVDPAARRHLAVHDEAPTLQLAEAVPRRPVANEIGVRDEHPRRVDVRLEDRDRLSGLDEQRLVRGERLEGPNYGLERLPVPRRLAGAAVDDKLVGHLRNLGVEVVHYHPEGGFL